MDNDIKILTQVVFKAHVDKCLTLETIDWNQIVIDTGKLVKACQQASSAFGTPFQTKPAGTPRGTKVVGDPCKDCGTPMVEGRTGAYCKSCYLKWKNSQGK
jgi:hypothetical protein